MKDRIAETARVIETSGRLARVRLEGGQTCRKCGLAAMGLCRPGGTGMVYEVLNGAGAAVGDRVKLGLDARLHARGYALAYAVPLLGLVLGGLGGWLLSNQTGPGGLDAGGAVLGLALGLYISLRRLKALDEAGKMYVRSIVPEVPDFTPEEAGSAEGNDYLRAYRRA